MQEARLIANKYEEDFDNLSSISPKWSSDLRNKAMDTFREIGFPVQRKGNEKWKYTNARPIADVEYSSAKFEKIDSNFIKSIAPWHESWVNLLFVNGYYQETFSGKSSTNIQISNMASVTWIQIFPVLLAGLWIIQTMDLPHLTLHSCQMVR